MSIDFTPERWVQIKETYRRWWARELERPLIPVQVVGRDPGRAKPDGSYLGQDNCNDFSISPEQIIDRIDYEISTSHFLGDAFPCCSMHGFGPGVIAAFLGATLDNSTGRVWFHPPSRKSIGEIHFRFDPDNVWFRRLCDIYRAGMERWQGQVLMTMTDLGGVQWVPGDGAPDCRHWPEIYQKIAAANKNIQLLGGFDVLDAVTEQLGSGNGIHLLGGLLPAPEKDSEAIRKKLARYGIE